MTDAIAKQVYDAVVAVIQTAIAGLDGLQAGEVQLRKVYRDQNQISRGITVSPGGTPEGNGTNAADDWGYGMLVYFATGTGAGYSEDIGRMTTWREVVRKLFHNKRLAAIPLNSVTYVSPGDSYISKELKANQDVSALLIRAWCRELRT